MSLGQRLKLLRGTTSQVDFGKLVGASQPTIRNYELDARLPDSDFIKSVCNRFGVTADWLIFGKEAERPDLPDSEPAPAPEPQPPVSSVPPVSLAPPEDLLGKYIACLEELNVQMRENMELRKEIADLRVEVERLRGRIVELEMTLIDTAEEPPCPSPVALCAAG